MQNIARAFENCKQCDPDFEKNSETSKKFKDWVDTHYQFCVNSNLHDK